MERQDIEVFLVLAEELHFGRTAERLRLSPARVTQVLQRTERQIGGLLFDRTNRRVALTPLGERLRADLSTAYANLRTAIERAQHAAAGEARSLRLGMIGWNAIEIQPSIAEFTAAHPGTEVKIRAISFSDPFGSLRAGSIDAVLAWLPVREPDLTVGPVVYTEPILLAMSAQHPLAVRETVTLEDLGDVTVMGGARPGYWQEAILPETTPGGRPITIGPTVDSFEEMLPILSSGEAVSPVHEHAARYARRADIAYRVITDAPSARWALVWRTAAETDTIRALSASLTPAPLESA